MAVVIDDVGELLALSRAIYSAKFDLPEGVADDLLASPLLAAVARRVDDALATHPDLVGSPTHVRNHASWRDVTTHGAHVLARVAALRARVPGWSDRPLDERERILADALAPLTLAPARLRELAAQA